MKTESTIFIVKFTRNKIKVSRLFIEREIAESKAMIETSKSKIDKAYYYGKLESLTEILNIKN